MKQFAFLLEATLLSCVATRSGLSLRCFFFRFWPSEAVGLVQGHLLEADTLFLVAARSGLPHRTGHTALRSDWSHEVCQGLNVTPRNVCE